MYYDEVFDTGYCKNCGKEMRRFFWWMAEIDESFPLVDSDRMCPTCARDYRRDHPDMEEEIAKAEYREER